MLEFTLPDKSCGHCASTVTHACKQVDPAAEIKVDLNAKRVAIDSGEARELFAQALAEAGYPPA